MDNFLHFVDNFLHVDKLWITYRLIHKLSTGYPQNATKELPNANQKSDLRTTQFFTLYPERSNTSLSYKAIRIQYEFTVYSHLRINTDRKFMYCVICIRITLIIFTKRSITSFNTSCIQNPIRNTHFHTILKYIFILYFNF